MPEEGNTRLGMTQNDCKRHQQNKGRKNDTETQNNQKIKENVDKTMLKYHKDVLNNPQEHRKRPKR